jgi:hypothetical protein
MPSRRRRPESGSRSAVSSAPNRSAKWCYSVRDHFWLGPAKRSTIASIGWATPTLGRTQRNELAARVATLRHGMEAACRNSLDFDDFIACVEQSDLERPPASSRREGQAAYDTTSEAAGRAWLRTPDTQGAGV